MEPGSSCKLSQVSLLIRSFSFLGEGKGWTALNSSFPQFTYHFTVGVDDLTVVIPYDADALTDIINAETTSNRDIDLTGTEHSFSL